MKILILLIPLLVFAKPNILLLETYKEQNITSWVMSEKLDGIRAYWDGENLITRNGNIINAPKWFLKDYPLFKIDGELWSKRKDFENILSIVRDKIPSENWKEIKHYIFEVPNVEGNLTTRLNKVKPYENNIIKIIPQIKIQNKTHLDNFFKDIISKGGEGVIVRDPTQPYINKRTRKALKIKSFKDDECKIIGFTDHSKNSAMIGAIKCELDNGVRFKIGSGLNNKLRLDPPNLGDIITFKYQEFTKYGKPRFPVFLRVRDVK